MESELSQKLCKRCSNSEHRCARAFKRYATPGSTVQMVSGVSAIHRLLEQIPQRTDSKRMTWTACRTLTSNRCLRAGHRQRHAVTVSNDSATGLGLIGTPDAR